MNINDVIKSEINAYEALDVDRDISYSEMKNVARSKIKETHPDKRAKNLSDEENKKLDDLNKIYIAILNGVLKNEDTKKQYDPWYDKKFGKSTKKDNTDNNDSKNNNKDNANKNNKHDTHQYSYTIDLEQYKKFACDRIDNMPFENNIKTDFKNKINNCKSLREVMDVLNEARKMRNGMSKGLAVQNNKMITKPKRPTPPVQQDNRKPYIAPEIEVKKNDVPLRLKPGRKKYVAPKLKVIEKKPSWLSRNWKKLLIGAGIAAAAIVAAPYICAPLMYLNSVAWHQFAMLKVPLHIANSVLGALGSISPFANITYTGSALGQWVMSGAFLNNTIINAGAINGSLLAGTMGAVLHLPTMGAIGFGGYKLAKKLYKETKEMIEDFKLSKEEKRKYEEELQKEGINEEDLESIREKERTTTSLKEEYQEMKNKRKQKKAEKNKKSGFINNFKERFNAFREKKNEKNELKDYKEEMIEYVENLGLSREATNILIGKISNAQTIEEIDNILDNDINVRRAEQENEQKEKLVKYQNKAIENNEKVFLAMKKDYLEKICNINVDMQILNEIATEIKNSKTMDEFSKCIKKSNKKIDEELAKNENNNNNKKRAA